MPTLRKTARIAAITFAGLFIAACLLGMAGAWWAERQAAEFVRNGFGLVETAAKGMDTGAARVNDLLATSREEVGKAAETITSLDRRAEESRPVLRLLSERLESNLTPHLAQMQQAVRPVRDAVATIADVVSLMSSLPGMADRAPRLAALDETFDRLEDLLLDAARMRSALQALVVAETKDLPAEPIARIHGLTQRIDRRLIQMQTNVRDTQADIAALRLRFDARQSRMLLVFQVLAAAMTALLAWILYSQIVVIRHHWK